MSQIVKNIQDRLLRQNKNWLAVICGPTGSGKSYSAISLAKSIDPNFSVREQLAFTPKQFMEILNSGKLKKGSAIVFDEAGVGIAAREWYSISNKLLNYVFQTFRTDNLAVIFTVPSFDFVDVNLRKLFHVFMETIAIDFTRRRCHLKFMELQFNPQIGKLYFKYPRTSDSNGHGVVTSFYLKKPNIKDCREYDKWREVYSTTLKTDTEDKLNPEDKEKIENTKVDHLHCKRCGRKNIYWTLNGMRCRLCGFLRPHEE